MQIAYHLSFIANKFKKTFLILFSLGFILFGLMLINSANHAQAASVSDLQKKQSEISQQIKVNQQKASETKNQIKTLSNDIDTVQANIDEIAGKIDATENQISDTQNQITAKEDEISKKEADLALQKLNQTETIRTVYETKKLNSPLRMLFSNLTLSQTTNHNTYLDALENRIEATMDEINKIKSDLEQEKQNLEKNKQDLEGLNEQNKAYQRGLDDQKNTKEQILFSKNQQAKSLDVQIIESKQMQSQVEAQIVQAIAAANSSSGRNVTARDRGVSTVGLMWPMDYQYISASFGDSTPFQSFHSGIDLVNMAGTPVYASAKGTVLTATAMQTSDGSFYGYGNYVIIGHNARFATLYGHFQSIAVSTGQEVEQGQIIGYEGTTGWSTGPHLHFEVREYNQPKNPLDYLP